MRSGIDGKLRLTPEGTLPLDAKGVEVTSFTRNWWIGVSLWHTLFTHEHNAVCDLLRARHPDWDDTSGPRIPSATWSTATNGFC